MERIEIELKEAGVYQLHRYGWATETDPDAEYIGHAMWQSDAPSIDEDALLNAAPVRRRPTEHEKEVLVTGEDFEGLMEASRLSIGLAMIWKAPAQANPINESTFFWLHHMDAFIKLAIASERLRDLLILGIASGRLKSYKRRPENPRYSAPFQEAYDRITERGIDTESFSNAVRQLPQLGVNLYEYIKRRNAIVHDTATRMAEFIKRSITTLQQRYDLEANKLRSSTETPTDAVARARTRREQRVTEMDHAVNELCEWYLLLVRASNFVFQVEYWTRKLEEKKKQTRA
jgi:hypothetical protein